MEKLRLIRKQKGMLQKDVAEYLGITASAYNHYESGRNTPDIATLRKLAELYGVSIDDFVDDTKQSFGRKIEEKTKLIPEEELLIPLVATLRCGPNSSGEPFTFIRDVPIPASYGRRWGENLQALIAVGESMSPVIIPGDLLICRPGDAWEDGNVVSINYEDQDMIKRIYATKDGVDLRSDNPTYKTIHVTADDINNGRFHVLGRVLLPIGREL